MTLERSHLQTMSEDNMSSREILDLLYRIAVACTYCVHTDLRLWNDDQGDFYPGESKNNHNSSRI